MIESPTASRPAHAHTAPAHVAEPRHGLLHAIWLGISWGLLALVALVGVIVILVPFISGSTPYTILTSSMEPGLPPGTLVVVRPVDPDDLTIGDVVTYQLESGQPTVVTHRIIAIEAENVPGGERGFITKGDANDVPDESTVMEVQLKGAVWYSVPLLGWVNTVVTGSMRGWLIPIAAGALFLYAAWLYGSQVRDKVTQRREARDAADEFDDLDGLDDLDDPGHRGRP